MAQHCPSLGGFLSQPKKLPPRSSADRLRAASLIPACCGCCRARPAGSGHAGGNATAGGRTTAHVASFHGAAATARRRKGDERRGREAPCVTMRRKEMALVWGGGREQRAEVGGPRRAAAASPLARACSGCRWGGVGRARNGHGVETLCASRSVRPLYRPRRGAGGCWSEQQTKTKASRAQRGYGPGQQSLSEAFVCPHFR